MPELNDPIVQRLVKAAENPETDDKEALAYIKSLKTYAEAKKLLEPEPIPEPEPTGVKAFFSRHAGDFIKAGTTLVVVTVIAVTEAKGDVIFRSKATKFIS
jgi:hypothetical protein